MICTAHLVALPCALSANFSRPPLVALEPSTATGHPSTRSNDCAESLREMSDYVSQPTRPSPSVERMEDAPVRDEERGKSGAGMHLPASLDVGANVGGNGSTSKEFVQDRKIRPGNNKSELLQGNPFTKAGRTSKSVWRKTETDDRKKIVNKTVIDFVAKQSTEEASKALARTADVFGNQSPMWDQMMKQLERRGARGKALEVFRFMQHRRTCELTERNFLTIIGILARGGKLALSREIFESMRKVAGITPTVLTYTAMISGYQKQGLVTKAWDVYELMQSESCRPNLITYNALIHACIKEPDKVLILFKALREDGLRPDDITYNCMINACVNGSDLMKANYVLEEMRKDKFFPNLVTYTSLINAYGKAGQLDNAVELFAEMKKNGCSPNSWTYNSLLKAYGNEGMYGEASNLYKEMECAGCVPTLYTFNTVIGLYGRGELFTEAENVLRDMQGMGLSPDRVTYNTLIYSYGKAGHIGKAKEVFGRMASNGCRPDLWTYNILLDSTAKYGTVEEAMQLFTDLKDAGQKPNVVTYGTLMTLYGRSGLFDVAQRTLWEMTRAGCLPNVTVYTGWIHSYARHGMFKEALAVFKDMVRAGIPPDVRSYTVLMDAFGRARLCDEAENLLKEMEDNGFVPDSITYSVIARAFANAERWHHGLKYYRILRQQADSSSQDFAKMMAGIESQYAHFIGSSQDEVDR